MKVIKYISSFIKFISLGKYRTPLYFNSSDSYSTVFSGVVTILVVTVLVAYAVFVAIGIFSRAHSNFDVQGMPLEHSMLTNTSLKWYTECGQKSCLKYTMRDNFVSFASQMVFALWIAEEYKFECLVNVDASVNLYG